VSERVARRICIAGEVSDVERREELRARARRLGLFGWGRLMEDGTLCAHAEGERAAVEEFVSSLSSVAAFDDVSERPARVEGH
jgi:acylphosphatase